MFFISENIAFENVIVCMKQNSIGTIILKVSSIHHEYIF